MLVKLTLVLITSYTLIFLFSCSNNSNNNLEVFKALDESLVNSNQTINKSNQIIYSSLQEKMSDPLTNYKANIWFPKAMQVQKYSKDIISYIENLKNELKKEVGLTIKNEQNQFEEDDIKTVNQLFKKKAKGEELFLRLAKYKQDVLAIDSSMKEVFDTVIIVTTRSFDTIANQNTFADIFFHNIPTIAALSMLSKFQNNIKIIENWMTMFCLNQVPSTDRYFDSYSAIVAQSTSSVKPNEPIEITAGIGAFSIMAQPVITISGKNVQVEEDGAAHYKFKASNKPGKHCVTVEITFNDIYGKKQSINKTVEYTVVE
jgi:gliding motility-associated protein GldM